ncbi:MAG TPA: outer membrane beta-barrel protein [Bryobacteraceae bacterium]|nr:outer membrane beta-barrel protein [Bryobacteraceae bacterium]
MSVFISFTRSARALLVIALLHGPALIGQTQTPDANRDQVLLDRIDRLEKRITELQVRLDEVTKPSPKAGESSSFDRSPSPTDPSLARDSGQQQKVPANQAIGEKVEAIEPFTFADFTWLTGNSRTTESPLETKVFTGEVRIDTDYVYDFNHPADHSIGGSSEIFRSGEVQLTQFGIGGDFHWNNVRGRLMTQFGMYSETTPRNDASPARGQWDLATAYRYISEAYGGYHFNKLNGINVDAGIFMSYVGLFSYYQFDNWAYQPSYVSSNTPWFFNGVRVQIFPTEKLKIEPWFVNGWQSYGTFNKAPGFGLQVLYRPNGWLSILGNQYTGTDTLGIPGRRRVHTDDSVQVKYYDAPGRFLDKAAMTLTIDAGCEFGTRSGVSCTGAPGKPAQYFLGFMSYQRLWFHHDLYAITLGGGAIDNPGRYLVLLPPINGATAISGSPYFTENPGDQFKAWDTSVTFDWMPKQFITWRFEYNHRASNVPYFTGPGGITPPGGNTGTPSLTVSGWSPDLRKWENRFTIAILVKL